MTDIVAGALLRYLELSLLIVLGLLLFRSLRWLAAGLALRVGSAGMSRLGRVVFLATLLSPFAAHLLLTVPTGSGSVSRTREGRTVGSSVELAEQLHRASQVTAGPFRPTTSDGAWSFLGRLEPWQVELAAALATAFLLSGFAVGAIRTGTRLRDLRVLVREAVPLRRLGRLSIVVSDRARVPFSTIVFGPAHIVLPVALLEDAGVLRVVLRHELQHYRRSDPVWAIALELFRLLFFWHPAARGWVRQLSDLQELACDEAIVRSGVPAKVYGTCLLHVAEMAVARRLVASTAMATASDRGAHLRRRISMLFHYDRNNDSRGWSVGLSVAAVFVLLAIAHASAGSWPTAADLPAVTSASALPADGPLAARVETLARESGVTIDAVFVADVALAHDIAPGVDVRMTATRDSLEAFLESMALEEDIWVTDLTIRKPAGSAPSNKIHATLIVRAFGDSSSLPRGNSTPLAAAQGLDGRGMIALSLDLLAQKDFSELRLVLAGENVIVFVKGGDGKCLAFPDELAPDFPVVSHPESLLKNVAPFAGDDFGPRREAPDLEFETTAGSRIQLASLEGKVVLVDFWASWCQPCKQELRHLKALDRELGGADFEIVGVSLSRDRSTFETFIADNQVPWPQRHEDDGWKSVAARAFEVKALPSHYLVDRDGRFIQVPLGDPEALAHTVAALINER